MEWKRVNNKLECWEENPEILDPEWWNINKQETLFKEGDGKNDKTTEG